MWDGGELDLILFLASAFAAALVAGLAGFAFGLIAAGVWLHLLAPAETAALIAGFGLLIQGVSVWRLRRALRLGRLTPFLVGGAIGVALGAWLLYWVDPALVRCGIGGFLILYSLYGLARPRLPPLTVGGRAADLLIGVVNGVVGGLTGLAAIIATVWCGARGWPKDEQRAVFQPVGVAVFLLTLVSLGSAGLVGTETLRRFAIGLPAVVAGTWLGLRLYGRLDEARFRRVVLVLLLVSGAHLLV